MSKFAFVIHPLEARDVARKYGWAKYLPAGLIEKLMLKKSPGVVSEITGIVSATGQKLEGMFLGCPLTSRQLIDKSLDSIALEKLVELSHIAKAEGATVMGLGAFTAITGDAGISLSQQSPVGITTGNSYTVATAIEGTLKAAKLVQMDPAQSTLAVVGATGSIGRTAAIVLARSFRNVVLIGRDLSRTQRVADEIPNGTATTDLDALRSADAVVTVTSSDTSIIEPHHLAPGALVCDVSRPRDVSVRVAKQRPDVLVIEGGVVSVPGNVEFNWEFGFPPKTAYACMCETMLLALEGISDHYTLGKEVRVDQVETTLAWAEKHGFTLAGFRSFEREVSEESIARAREARLSRGSSSQSIAVTA